MNKRQNKKPVLLLGGSENTLAIARSLSDLNIDIFVSTARKSGVHQSRFCKKLYYPLDGTPMVTFWQALLLTDIPRELDGAVVLCCSDEAVEFVAVNRDQLQHNFVLEENSPEVQLSLLDKHQTIELALRAGVKAPRAWYEIENDPYFRSIDINFPILVKPINSHLYKKVYKFKLLQVENRDELEAHLEDVKRKGLKVMLTEFVPGPDSQLCSYYTYIDKNGHPLFDYTKSVIRRYPKSFGSGCYHISEWQPDVVEEGRKFFKSIGYRGLGNIEFKRDLRDNSLKLIESNPRFTAAHELLVKSGICTDKIVYSILTDIPYNIPNDIKYGERLLYPWKDFNSFRQRKALGELTFYQWIKSISCKQNFPYFNLSDPLPGLYQLNRLFQETFVKKFLKN